MVKMVKGVRLIVSVGYYDNGRLKEDIVFGKLNNIESFDEIGEEEMSVEESDMFIKEHFTPDIYERMINEKDKIISVREYSTDNLLYLLETLPQLDARRKKIKERIKYLAELGIGVEDWARKEMSIMKGEL